MSALPPPPPGRGGPSPRRRWTVPWAVPAGTLIFFAPPSAGTSIVAPWSASATVIGTVTSRLPPSSRVKTGEAATRVVTKRAPGGPPRRPARALPPGRAPAPPLAPGGTFALLRLVRRVPPRPAAGRAGFLDPLARPA